MDVMAAAAIEAIEAGAGDGNGGDAAGGDAAGADGGGLRGGGSSEGAEAVVVVTVAVAEVAAVRLGLSCATKSTVEAFGAWLSSCSIMGGQGLRPARRRWLTACPG